MNKVLLNTVGLDGEVIIKKGSGGGGGGVSINNQSKSVEFTENGTSEVRYDAGYTGLEKVSVKVAIPIESKSVTIVENGTSEVAADEGYLDKVSVKVAIPTEEKTIDITENGTTEVVADNGFLSKVVVNTNVQSGEGGNSGGVDIFAPFVDDGKTRVWVSILQEEEKSISLAFTQSSKNGVEVDFGDGSPIVTDTDITPASCFIEHNYEKIGQYCITLSPKADTTYELGNYIYQNSFFPTNLASTLSRNVMLRVDIGNKCIGLPLAFRTSSVRIVNFSPTSQLNAISTSAFREALCPHFILPKTITAFEADCFGATNYSSLRVIDCSALTTVPSLKTTSSLPSAGYGNKYKIVVPDALFSEWVAATNWSSLASNIVKASEFNG